MRRAISVLCLLALVPLFLLFFRVSAELPNRTTELVREKYQAWSGVLRLWVYEGWDARSTTWLNRAIASFEKANPGVYVQARKVEAGALRAFITSGVNPPDMLLFPPGLLDSPDGLLPLGALPALRDGLAECANGYAAPVMMGAYAWAYDRGALSELPAGLEGAALACAPSQPYASLPAALIALCSGGRAADIEPERPGLDLGLPASAAPDDIRMPEGFSTSQSAYADFVGGKCSLLPVTQGEIRRLCALAEAGKGPDWATAAAGEAMLADQLLLLGVVDWPRPDTAERQTLCRAFVQHLLGEESQAALSACGALPVVEGAAVYAGRAGYEALEIAARLPLLVPNAFDALWRARLEETAQAFLSGRIGAREALARLRDHCQ